LERFEVGVPAVGGHVIDGFFGLCEGLFGGGFVTFGDLKLGLDEEEFGVSAAVERRT
jgi:hypothetical protein